MKISATYRLFTSMLSLSILIGVSVPAGLHTMSGEVCNEMQKIPHPISEHAEECPMNGQPVEIPVHQHPQKTDKIHHNANDLCFVCACSIDEAPVKAEAKVQFKTKVSVLQVVQILSEIHTDESENHAFQIPVSDSYSPPPIYLANESFLI